MTEVNLLDLIRIQTVCKEISLDDMARQIPQELSAPDLTSLHNYVQNKGHFDELAAPMWARQ